VDRELFWGDDRLDDAIAWIRRGTLKGIESERRGLGMDETKLEKLARLSGKAASKALGALERRGYDIRGKLSAPISRVPRRDPPKPKSDD
jgi:predicted transcriptional regulator